MSRSFGEVAIAQPDDRRVIQLFEDLCFAKDIGHRAIQAVGAQGLDHDP